MRRMAFLPYTRPAMLVGLLLICLAAISWGTTGATMTLLARETGVPSLLGVATAEMFRIALARGMGDLDHTAVVSLLEEWTGTELRSRTGGQR